MGLTDNTYTVVESSKTKISNGGVEIKDEWTVNPGNPFKESDYAVIIKAFEVECSNWQQTDYAKAHHYRDVYSTRNFSERVRKQMDYYPGMHQSSSPPETDPFYTEAEKMARDKENYWNGAMESPTSFMSGLERNQKDFDYTKIFGPNVSAENRAKEIGKMLTECIPCFGRLLDGAQLLPDGDLLEIHALNIKLRTDLLDKIMALFKDPGAMVNICDLLKFLTHTCLSDLLAILAVLTQYLAKLNLDFRFNLDFIIQLVGPILSPFLDALSQWLDKWIQLILGPMTCVIDHINETILIAQDMQIPFSDVSANVGMDIGIAGPAHKNAAFKSGSMQSAGVGDPSMRAGEQGAINPFAFAWAGWQWEEFNTPDEQKYNPTIPEYPIEETELAAAEARTMWTDNITEAERAERDRRWKELKAAEQAKRNKIPAPERPESQHDGTRWSKDDIPESEKYKTGDQWSAGYHPPEKQTKVQDGDKYFVTTPLVGSIVELRIMLQAAIQYIKDWFEYITQMIYDLLGTDFGWMSKKTSNTMIKSRLIELILLVKSIIEAISKNGLECGKDTNYDASQMKYILEESLNKVSKNKFTVMQDGTIKMTLPGQDPVSVNTTDNNVVTGSTPDSNIITQPIEQKTTKSGIIIKDCFKTISTDELSKVRSWIAEFENRGA